MTQTPEAGHQVSLTNSGSEHFRLRAPIVLDVRREEDGSYLVSEDQFNLYGTGPTLAGAIQDYQDMLIEHYQDLAASEECLSEYLRQQFITLTQLLEPR